METRYLHIFVTVVESGTITAASKKLHIAQSALSRSIQKIEEDYGAQLIIRGTRKITLTNAGRIFYSYATRAIKQDASIRRELMDTAEGFSGTLRIGAVANYFALWLRDVFPQFHEVYPNIKFEIFEGESKALVQQLRNGECDIAFLRGPIDSTGLNVFDAMPDPLTVSYWKDYDFFADKKDCTTISIEDLKDIPLFVNRHWYPLIYPFCEKAGFRPNVLALNDRMNTTVQWARFVPGCVIAPIRSIKLFGEQGFISKFIDEPQLNYNNCVATVKDRYLPQVAQNFLDFCLPTIAPEYAETQKDSTK